MSLAIGVVSLSVALDLLRVGGADDAEAHLHGELAVALLVDRALQADGATGAGEVEDLDRARDLGGLHDLRRGAGGRVVAAAGGVGDHDLQVAGGEPPAAAVPPAAVSSFLAVAPQAERARAVTPTVTPSRTDLRAGVRVLIVEVSFAFCGWNGMIVACATTPCRPCVSNEG